MSSIFESKSPFKRVEIIAVGSELLTPLRSDTNSLFLTRRLNELGIEVQLKMIVGDTVDDLSAVFAQAYTRSDLIIVSGGLGPTDDDLTRETVAKVLGLPLERDEKISERIRERFSFRGLQVPEINYRQAMVPRGATIIKNAHGTAPGLWIECGKKVVLLVPGPPHELIPIFEQVAKSHFSKEINQDKIFRKVLQITGRTESQVEERAQPVYEKWKTESYPISTTILSKPGQIELHLCTRAVSKNKGESILNVALQEMSKVLGESLYSTDGRSLEEVVGDLLRDRGYRIAVAESCTGGLITSRLTDVAGSSDYLETGIVAYSNRVKNSILGVSKDLILQDGAVSESVAAAMAVGAKNQGKSQIGLGVTGVAGPGGGTTLKPVGTVAIAVSCPDNEIEVAIFKFLGNRSQIKFQASQTALDMVRRLIA